MKIDWKRKLTSRKFWIAVTTMATCYIMAFGGTAETAETVTGCIAATATAIAYVIGEGLTDSTNVNSGKDNADG